MSVAPYECPLLLFLTGLVYLLETSKRLEILERSVSVEAFPIAPPDWLKTTTRYNTTESNSCGDVIFILNRFFREAHQTCYNRTTLSF